MRKILDYISNRFYLGVSLIIISLIVGSISKIVFILFFEDRYLRWLMVVLYILSWVPLFIGVWMAGKDYYDAVSRYFSYKFYHRHMKTQAKRAYSKARSVASSRIKRKS